MASSSSSSCFQYPQEYPQDNYDHHALQNATSAMSTLLPQAVYQVMQEVQRNKRPIDAVSFLLHLS